MQSSPLLETCLDDLLGLSSKGPVLDLACGGGRNGLYLLSRGVPVVFADIRADALEQISEALAGQGPTSVELWQVDLEDAGSSPLAGRLFSAIMVFRYLHRPLMPSIRDAICPGGLLIYETFTVEQPNYGRPKNPDFLLQPGELLQCFGDWQVLHSFEGIEGSGKPGEKRAIAQIVARKPG